MTPLEEEERKAREEPMGAASTAGVITRIERGGAWSFTREWRRAASRYRDSAMTRDTGRGIRLVMSLPQVPR